MSKTTFTFSDGETVTYTHVRPVLHAFRILDQETGKRVRSIGYSTSYRNAVRAVQQSLRSMGDSERNGFVIFWPASPSLREMENAKRQASLVGYTGGNLRAFVKDHNERVLERRRNLCNIEIVARDQSVGVTVTNQSGTVKFEVTPEHLIKRPAKEKSHATSNA